MCVMMSVRSDEQMGISRQDTILQPDFPYQQGVIAEAFRLALDGTTPETLAGLAEQNGRSLAYIMLNLRKVMRKTPQKIGKRGWQWDLEETPSCVRITKIWRTLEQETRAREKYGVRNGSEKP